MMLMRKGSRDIEVLIAVAGLSVPGIVKVVWESRRGEGKRLATCLGMLYYG